MENQNQFGPGLAEQFIRAAQRSAATVERIKHSASALKEALTRLIKEEDMVLLAEPDDISTELFSSVRQLPNVATNPTDHQLSSIKIGITDAFAGVARTGSICVSVSKNLGGSVSLFTREHIAILDARTILPRPRDLFSEEYLDGKGLERDFVFITGPSATADMGPLVRGVHGPGKLYIIVLE